MKSLLCCLACFTTALADTPEQSAARIDAALARDYQTAQQQLQKHNSPALPALPPLADDATFLRRACIDLAGRLPRMDEARAFLANPSPAKRILLTDALVREPGAAEVRFRMLAEAFRVKDDPAVIAWLRQAAADDRPYDQIVTYLVGEGHVSRRDGDNPLRTASEVAFAALGEDIQCAMCHDHPFNDHTEMEAYQFAACFTASDDFNGVRVPLDYKYRDGKPGELVKPRLLRLTREAPPQMKRNKAPLMQVAQWLTTESSHRFATVSALRVWSGLFGMPELFVDRTVGGVDPAPPWHEADARALVSRNCFCSPSRDRITWIGQDFSQGLVRNAMNVLGEEFQRCGLRMGEFQRILGRTNAYWRSGFDLNTAWNGSYLVPAPQIRRLPSEVVWDVLSDVKSDQLPQVPPLEHPLRMLGRGTREWSDESTTPISYELVRFMLNSREVEDTSAIMPANASTEDLFIAIIGRLPNGMEKAIAQQHRNESPQTATQDIAWALLNTTEFMFRP